MRYVIGLCTALAIAMAGYYIEQYTGWDIKVVSGFWAGCAWVHIAYNVPLNRR